MAGNPNYTEIIASTMENRSSEVQDAVSNNNAVYFILKKQGRVKTFDGGRTLVENIALGENANFVFYNNYDELPVGAQELITSAEYPFKLAAVPVTMSGEEDLKNSGQEAVFDLMEERMDIAEKTMVNRLDAESQSDGTTYGGKGLTGFGLAIPVDPTTGTVGGINRATTTQWRSKYAAQAGVTSTNVLGYANSFYNDLVRGTDKPNLMIAGTFAYNTILGSVQPLQRFSDPDMAKIGFETIKFLGSDLVLGGGMGGNVPTGDILYLNTRYIKLRVHARRNMVPIGKNRTAVNQDAVVNILGWAGNLTYSNLKMQGRQRLSA